MMFKAISGCNLVKNTSIYEKQNTHTEAGTKSSYHDEEDKFNSSGFKICRSSWELF